MKQQNNNLSRRSFVKNTVITSALLPLYGHVFSMFNSNADTRLKIHIFSKHLQFLNYEDMANAAAENAPLPGSQVAPPYIVRPE